MILFQKRLTWVCWFLLVKPFCFRGFMAILCLAAEVSRQPRGLAGMVKSTGRKLLPREPGAPRAAEDEGLIGLEEAPEGIYKNTNMALHFLLSYSTFLLAYSPSEAWNDCVFGHKSLLWKVCLMLSLHRNYLVLCSAVCYTEVRNTCLVLSHSKSLICPLPSHYLKSHLQYMPAPAGDTGAVFIAAFSSW